MKTFTLVGYYPDTEQRFCTTIKAKTVCRAQYNVIRRFAGVAICGVFKGKLLPVDWEFPKIAYDKDYLP